MDMFESFCVSLWARMLKSEEVPPPPPYFHLAMQTKNGSLCLYWPVRGCIIEPGAYIGKLRR